MTTTETTKSHAVKNAEAHLKTIVELYRYFLYNDCQELTDEMEEELDSIPLSIEVRSTQWQSFDNWASCNKQMKPDQGRILLSTGGPACQIICDLEDGCFNGETLEIQHQDWFKPWENLDSTNSIDYKKQALEWFVNRFFFG